MENKTIVNKSSIENKIVVDKKDIVEKTKSKVNSFDTKLVTSTNDIPTKVNKTRVTCLQATTLSELISMINTYNENTTHSPILKNDIVSVLKYGEGWILLYYK